jgi:RNA polymerase sigma-70 factor, ECF subfamily
MDLEKPDQDPAEADFVRLFMTHESALLRFVIGFVPCLADAHDVVQETAVTLWKKRGEFDASKPFLPWAYGIARWKVREHWHKRRHLANFADEALIEQIEARREQLGAELSARSERLQACLAKLPDAQRSVIFGYYIEERSVEELAELQDKSTEAIYKLLQRVRRALQDCVSAGFEGRGVAP